MTLASVLSHGIAFMLGVIASFQVSIMRNAAQIRRNSETIRRKLESR